MLGAVHDLGSQSESPPKGLQKALIESISSYTDWLSKMKIEQSITAMSGESKMVIKKQVYKARCFTFKKCCALVKSELFFCKRYRGLIAVARTKKCTYLFCRSMSDLARSSNFFLPLDSEYVHPVVNFDKEIPPKHPSTISEQLQISCKCLQDIKHCFLLSHFLQAKT